MNTYRAVLWAKIENEAGQTLYIFNSHYPLSGDSQVRLKCAQLEMQLIPEIARNTHWISAGDRNLISHQKDNEVYNPKTVHKELVKLGHDVRNADKHYGVSETWLGFIHDPYKSKVGTTDTASQKVLDVMVSSKVAIRSFCHPGIFNPVINKLIDLSEYDETMLAQQNQDRYFASDHAMLGGDFNFYPDTE